MLESALSSALWTVASLLVSLPPADPSTPPYRVGRPGLASAYFSANYTHAHVHAHTPPLGSLCPWLVPRSRLLLIRFSLPASGCLWPWAVITFSVKPFLLSYLKLRCKRAHLTLTCLVPPTGSFLGSPPSLQMLRGMAIGCLRVSPTLASGVGVSLQGPGTPPCASTGGRCCRIPQADAALLPAWAAGILAICRGQGAGPCQPLLTTSMPTVLLVLSSFHTPVLSAWRSEVKGRCPALSNSQACGTSRNCALHGSPVLILRRPRPRRWGVC